MSIVGFVLFLALFGLIGLWSARRADHTEADYLLAGRSVSPVLAALSAAATKYSGYMFIGLMGYVYSFGLSAIWLVFGFFFGDLIAFTFVHAKVRNALRTKLEAVSPTYLDLGEARLGGLGAVALFGFGWLFTGIGVTGQPQVMVRFMALDRTEHTRRTGLYHFLWSGLFLAATFLVGLSVRAFISETGGFDAELALPALAQDLLPGLAVGVIVGGVFAASMSTADSQVLSCAAVLSDDVKLVRGHAARRLATAVVILVTVGIAAFASASVFTLVIFAWSALACSIGPLVILHALGQRPSQRVALIMMGAGLTIALLWRQTELKAAVYEGLPGMAAAFTVWALGHLISKRRAELG